MDKEESESQINTLTYDGMIQRVKYRSRSEIVALILEAANSGTT